MHSSRYASKGKPVCKAQMIEIFSLAPNNLAYLVHRLKMTDTSGVRIKKILTIRPLTSSSLHPLSHSSLSWSYLM